MNDFMVGQIIILITTILGIVVQIYRENRARRWAKEDREESRLSRELIHKKLDDRKPAVFIRSTDAKGYLDRRREGVPADRRRSTFRKTDTGDEEFYSKKHQSRRLGDNSQDEQE